jgi:hypothetical protein
MGWAFCGKYNGRWIGYGVPARCDEKGCKARIDRGLAYVCGRMHGGDGGCGGYFCYEHLFLSLRKGVPQRCAACSSVLPYRRGGKGKGPARRAHGG